ncbi:MAG: ABC transporter substrate-binding protein [Treponema sp.]|nr:ABC transporter substrate-binding protein [Treponema sp.]
MKKTKVFVLAIALSLVFSSLVFAGGGAQAGGSAGTIKMGMIFPFSGANADQGVFNRYGAELAVEKINAAGGIKALNGRKLEVIFYDNQSSADTSRAVAERLLAEHPDIVAAHGAASSAYVLPMLATFEKARVPFLTAQTSQTITSQGYQYVFAFASQAPQFAATQIAMLNWLNDTYKIGITKVGLVYEDSEWGLTQSQSFRDAVKSSGNLTLAYDKSYQASSSDLSSLIVGLMDAGCEVVCPISYTQDSKVIFNTMLSYRYSPLIIGGGAGILYPVFGRDLGPLVDGVLSVASHNYDAKSIRQNTQFANVGEEYEAKFKEFMPEQAVSAFNAVYIVAQALEKTASTDSVKIRDAISAMSITSLTPGGALSFNKAGWNQNGVAVMIQWQKDKDGNFRPHSVFPPSEATIEFQLTELLKTRIE